MLAKLLYAFFVKYIQYIHTYNKYHRPKIVNMSLQNNNQLYNIITYNNGQQLFLRGLLVCISLQLFIYCNIIPKSSEQQWFLAGLTSYILEGGRRGGKKEAKQDHTVASNYPESYSTTLCNNKGTQDEKFRCLL